MRKKSIIKRSIVGGIITTSLVIGFSGCSGTNQPLPPKQMSTSSVNTVEENFIFKDSLNDKPITKREFIYLITKHLSSNSNYSHKKIKSNSIRTTYGQTVAYKNNELIVNYFYGDQNCNSKCQSSGGSVTKVTYKLPIEIKENSENNFTVKVSTPKNYIVRPHTNALGITYDPLDTLGNLENDVKRMVNSLKYKVLTKEERIAKVKKYNPSYALGNYKAILKSLEPKVIKVQRDFNFNGEVNSEYQMESVYANISRALSDIGGYGKSISDEKMTNMFYLDKYAVTFEVYPYKNGSKVVYKGNLKYTIDSQGNTSLDSKMVEDLRTKIKNIINN